MHWTFFLPWTPCLCPISLLLPCLFCCTASFLGVLPPSADQWNRWRDKPFAELCITRRHICEHTTVKGLKLCREPLNISMTESTNILYGSVTWQRLKHWDHFRVFYPPDFVNLLRFGHFPLCLRDSFVCFYNLDASQSVLFSASGYSRNKSQLHGIIIGLDCINQWKGAKIPWTCRQLDKHEISKNSRKAWTLNWNC